MSKKRGPKGAGRTGTPLTVYLPPEHRQLLELLVGRSRRTYTNEVIVALELLGAREGCWPLPADAQPSTEEPAEPSDEPEEKSPRKRKGT